MPFDGEQADENRQTVYIQAYQYIRPSKGWTIFEIFLPIADIVDQNCSSMRYNVPMQAKLRSVS